MAKAFAVPFKYVLYEVSYANLILYSASLPTYGGGEGKDKKKGRKGAEEEILWADDPKNKERVKAFFKSIQ